MQDQLHFETTQNEIKKKKLEALVHDIEQFQHDFEVAKVEKNELKKSVETLTNLLMVAENENSRLKNECEQVVKDSTSSIKEQKEQ